MKKWIVFSLLKLLEIALFVFVPYSAGLIGNFIGFNYAIECPAKGVIATSAIGIWLVGWADLMMVLVGLAIPALVIVILWAIIKANIDWADSIIWVWNRKKK